MTTQNEQQTEQKRRTITLTDRPPVSIVEDEWPVIARGDGDSWAGSYGDGQYYQARDRGEIDEYTLRVRQHADGRAIVYGVVRSGYYKTQYEDWRGGELLEPGADIARAIRRVAEGRMPDRVIRECIADLPAEEV